MSATNTRRHWTTLALLSALALGGLAPTRVAHAQPAPEEAETETSEAEEVADGEGAADGDEGGAETEPAPGPDADATADEGGAEAIVAPAWDETADHQATLTHSSSLAPEPEDPAPADESDADDVDPTYRPFLLELGALAGLNYQRLTYRDDLYGFLRPYSLSNAKSFGGYIEAYPLALAVGGALGRLGVEGRYVHMVNFDSLRSDGNEFPTRARELIVGLRYRLLPRSLQARGMQLSVGLGGGHQVFQVTTAIAQPNLDNDPSVPARHYRFARADLGGRFALDLGFFISFHAGLRVVIDAGEIDSRRWFPRARRAGIESGIHLGYVLPKDLEVQLGFEAQRYFFNVRPQTGDTNIVGGALDRYVLVDVRLGWRY